jgi:hypothetical protein
MSAQRFEQKGRKAASTGRLQIGHGRRFGGAGSGAFIGRS